MSETCGWRNARGLTCGSVAGFEVMPVSVTVDPDDHSYACQLHVGAVLTSMDGRAEQWSVYQLTPTP